MPRRLLLAFVLCAAAAAQPTGSVQGTVLNSVSRQPVRKAAVMITATSPDRSYAIAVTDSTGQFTLPALPAGRYRLQASRQGYQPIPYGALSPNRPGTQLNLAAGEVRTGIALLLAPVNMISGAVTDPEGDRVPGVRVDCFRKQFDRGKSYYESARQTATDSRGYYELTNIPAGEYLVMAHGGFVPAFRTRPVLVMGEKLQQETLGAQFYPGVDRAESASPVVLVAGRDTTGIDFHLNYAAQVSLHGSISGLPEDAGRSTVMLQTSSLGSLRDMVAQAPVNPEHPAYRFDGLAPGRYRLTARAGSRRTILDVNLTSPDTELNLEFVPGARIEGSVTVEGPGADAVKNFRVTLSPGDDAGPANLRAETEDGKFEFEEVPAGIWDIGVNPLPRGAYIKSMRLGDKDVLLEDMTIGPQSKGPLAIVISTAAPRVEGTAEPAGPVTVLAAPTGKLAKAFSFYQTTQSDEKGRFTILGLNPGTYRFYAFRDLEPQAWQQEGFLLPFESQAKQAELKEGATETVTLPVIGGAHP